MILIALFMISCDNDNGYSENVKAVKKVVSAFELGDVEIWKEAVSEDLVYSPPIYGTQKTVVIMILLSLRLNFTSIILRTLNLITLYIFLVLILSH